MCDLDLSNRLSPIIQMKTKIEVNLVDTHTMGERNKCAATNMHVGNFCSFRMCERAILCFFAFNLISIDDVDHLCSLNETFDLARECR